MIIIIISSLFVDTELIVVLDFSDNNNNVLVCGPIYTYNYTSVELNSQSMLTQLSRPKKHSERGISS